MKSSATITKVGWVEPSATQHQDGSNIFHNCYYRDLNKFKVHTKPKPAMCQANTSPLQPLPDLWSTPQKPGFFTVLASLLIQFKKPGFSRSTFTWNMLYVAANRKNDRTSPRAIALLAISIARFMVDIHLSYRVHLSFANLWKNG